MNARGDSGTPLAKKRGLVAGCRVRLLHAPAGLKDGLASWPRKAAKRDTDLTEVRIRALALPPGFVDVKVCAVSDVGSGLKLVVRKELR